MMNWLHELLLRYKPYYLFIEWTKGLIVPVFGYVSLYIVGSFFLKEINKGSLANKASSLAYSFMLAIFPAIIFLFALIPYIPIANFQQQLLELIHLVLPQNAYMAVEATLNDIVKNQNSKLLSFGFVFALIFATNGVHNLMDAFNKSSLIIETRTWLKQRFVALVLTILTALALISGLVIITLGEYFFGFLKSELLFEDSFWLYVIALARWIILVAIYFTTTSILYRYGPATTEKWHFFSAGSCMATVLAIFTFWGFAFYINHFSTYNKLYGSIGTLIVIMVWLYLNSFILLLGFEFNASIDLSKRSIKMPCFPVNTFRSPLSEKFPTESDLLE